MSSDLAAQLAQAQATIRALEEELAVTNRGLLALNLELEQRVDERTEAIRRQNATLVGINQVLNAALACQTEEELGRACLDVAETITQSRFGFIGEINEKGLQDIAISNPGWDACQMRDASGHRRPLGNFKIHGIYGRVLTDAKSLITNDPAGHPDSIGTPEGHPPLRSFLGVPLLREGRAIGMIAVGNREGGYTADQQLMLEALAPAIVEAFLRKRAEQALRKAQAALQAHADDLEKTVAARTAKLQETIADLEHFSYAIIHDMRAPLRAMQSFAQLLEEDCATCAHNLDHDYFRRIRIASNRMDRLITDSLDYSRAVRQQLALEPIALGPLINDLIETYPNLQPDRVDIQVQPDLPIVQGNEAALTQCLSNLLDNAVKFAKPGAKPQIRVLAETRDQVVRLWVEDEGIGIPKLFQRRVFDMFQRGTNRQEGTGIGLAIVRKLIQRMGGEVGVLSEEGKGSRFWVELPIVEPR